MIWPTVLSHLQDMGIAGIAQMLAVLFVIVVFFSWLGRRDPKGPDRAALGGSTGDLEPVQAVAEVLREKRAAKGDYTPDTFETLVVELGTMSSIAGDGRLEGSLATVTPDQLERAATLAETLKEPDCAAFFRDIVPLIEVRRAATFGARSEAEAYQAQVADAQEKFDTLDVNARLWQAANAVLHDGYPWRAKPKP